MRWLATLVVAALPHACRIAPTEVLICFDTDAPLDRTVSIRAFFFGESPTPRMTWTRVPDISGGLELPASFAVVPGATTDRDAPVTLIFELSVAAGRNGEPAINTRRALRFGFTHQQTTHVDVFLPVACGGSSVGCTSVDAASCTLSIACEDSGRTCFNDGLCAPVQVLPAPASTASICANMSQPTDGGTDVTNDTRPDAADVVPPDVATDVPTDGPPCGMCPVPSHGSPTCIAGMCGIVCDVGWADCDLIAATGCETPLRTSQNCARCGDRCARTTTPVCASDGMVTWSCVPTCPTGQSNCGGMCVSLQGDPFNCGTCGNRCSNGSCFAGRCGCATGMIRCGLACVDPLADPNNCGMCGQLCTMGLRCVMGVCTM